MADLVLRADGDGPAVLFAHSYLCSGAQFDAPVAVLTQRFRCLRADLWGHGGPLDGVPTDLDGFAAAHAAALDALGVARCVIVGSSVGAMWALRLALARPALVAGLVLVGGSGGAEPDESRLRYHAMLDATERLGALPPPVVERIAPGFVGPAWRAREPGALDEFAARLRAWPRAAVPALIAVGRTWIGRDDVLSRLGSLRVPTLIIVGTQDPFRPPHEARQLAAALRAPVLEWADAGHLPDQDRPVEFAERVHAFAAQIFG